MDALGWIRTMSAHPLTNWPRNHRFPI